MHVPMSCKTESLYKKVMEWLKEECPLLQPENMSVDFELAILNSAEEVFHVIPTGCDFHYNQAIYRKFGKIGLRPILTQNANFGKWAYQIMALNHLPSDQIEPTFRELCSQDSKWDQQEVEIKIPKKEENGRCPTDSREIEMIVTTIAL